MRRADVRPVALVERHAAGPEADVLLLPLAVGRQHHDDREARGLMAGPGITTPDGFWYADESMVPKVAPPPVALANDFAGHLRNWLGRQGYRTADVPISFAPMEGELSDAQGVTTGTGISFAPGARAGMEALAGRYGKRGRLGNDQLLALNQLAHELIHSGKQEFDAWHAGATDEQIDLEEASTYQAVDDLLPAMTRQLFGHAWRPAAQTLARGEAVFKPPYEVEQKQLRQASVFGSGAGKYQDRKARLWRRAFSQADQATRDQMMGVANTRAKAFNKKRLAQQRKRGLA